MKATRRVAVKMMVAASSMGSVVWAQMGGQPSQTPNIPGMPPPVDPLGRNRLPETDPSAGKIETQQAKLRNNERQKRLEQDADKLLVLATELKQDVEKTDKNILSVDVIKKADEIEKLAKSVKDRMKG